MPQGTPMFTPRRIVAIAAFTLLFGLAARASYAGMVVSEDPQISAGAEAAAQMEALRAAGLATDDAGSKHRTDTLIGGTNWDAIKFFDVALLTGFFNIPPDPMGAPGPTQNIDVVNTGIESWDKTGTLQWRSSLKNFVISLVGGNPGTLGTDGFDCKIVYDQQAGRFVVCLLERKTSAPTASRILVAVSKTSAPASATTADWYYYAINSQLTIAGAATFADYPGLEIDEDAIYITTNQFRFTGAFAGSRLWIVQKAAFYAGGAPVSAVYDPYAAVAGSVATTTMPALVFGAGGASPGVGTYLVSYSGLNDGTFEYVQVIRVDDPLGGGGGPFFKGEFINIGAIDNVALALPKGPQLGSAVGIDSGDRRVYDAVWRNNNLWLTATTLPVAGPNTGETTTHWWRIDTSGVTSSASPAGLLVLGDQGEAGANDIAPGAMTAWSGIAVNSLDEMKLTYAVFAPTRFASYGIAGRQPADPAGTLQPSVIVRSGVAPYVRTFTAGSTGRNRWGDFSGMGVDPSDDRTFWSFNEWADVQGNPTNVGGTIEDGQWATTWAQCSFACFTLQCPPPTHVQPGVPMALPFCITNCSSINDTFTYHIINQNGWCPPQDGQITLAAGQTQCVPMVCVPPPDAICGFAKPVQIVVTSSSGQSFTCATELIVDCPPPCIQLACPPVVNVHQGDSVVLHFCVTNCAPRDETVTFTINNAMGWCAPMGGPITIPAGATVCIDDACAVPPDAVCGFTKPVTFIVTTASGQTFACETAIKVDCTVPTRMFASDAESEAGGVMLHWTMADGAQYQGFDVYREEGNTGRVKANSTMLTGGPEFSYFDPYVSTQPVNYWLAEIGTDGGTNWHGPIAVTGGTPLPTTIAFAPARPNPFAATTAFSYTLPREANVRLTVYDAAGHLVRSLVDGVKPAGVHSVTWNGTDLSGRRAPVGLYMVVLNAGGELHRQKVLLGR